MIVWLASYPRSGNTLLRQVLKHCFNLNSCESLERVPEEFRKEYRIREEYYGSYFLEGDPEEFYRRSRDCTEPVLIKSHLLPRDDAKAIYVVRDGRLALKSYVKFQDTVHPGSSTFESLLVGDHPYGEWSSHYRAWCENRSGETLVVRFEELVSADNALLKRLADFIGYDGSVREWVNPITELSRRDPSFFGNGDSVWRADSFWSESRLRQFYTLHGGQLTRLGYATSNEIAAYSYPANSSEARLLHFAHSLVARKCELQNVCDERLAVINAIGGSVEAVRCEMEAVRQEMSGRIAELEASLQAAEERLRRSNRYSLTGLLSRFSQRRAA